MTAVAQLDRVSDYESECRGFKSHPQYFLVKMNCGKNIMCFYYIEKHTLIFTTNKNYHKLSIREVFNGA